MACQDENESLLVQHQRQEPARLSGMSVASSIDRPISRAPSRSNLGPSAGSQHGHSHSSGSEEVRHIFRSWVPPCRAPSGLRSRAVQACPALVSEHAQSKAVGEVPCTGCFLGRHQICESAHLG